MRLTKSDIDRHSLISNSPILIRDQIESNKICGFDIMIEYDKHMSFHSNIDSGVLRVVWQSLSDTLLTSHFLGCGSLLRK